MVRIRTLDDGGRHVIACHGLTGLAADLEVRHNRPVQGAVHPFAPEIADDVPKAQVRVPIGPRPTGGRRAVGINPHRVRPAPKVRGGGRPVVAPIRATPQPRRRLPRVLLSPRGGTGLDAERLRLQGTVEIVKLRHSRGVDIHVCDASPFVGLVRAPAATGRPSVRAM